MLYVKIVLQQLEELRKTGTLNKRLLAYLCNEMGNNPNKAWVPKDVIQEITEKKRGEQ